MGTIYLVESHPTYGHLKNVRIYHNADFGKLLINFDRTAEPASGDPDDPDYEFDATVELRVAKGRRSDPEPWVVSLAGSDVDETVLDLVRDLPNVHVQ